MDVAATLADLQARCAQIRLSNRELADLADLDVATVDRTFSGKTSPVLRTIGKISDAIDAAERERLPELARIVSDLAARHGGALAEPLS